MHINLKFLQMTNFSPHISFVIFATNMRYAWKPKNEYVKKYMQCEMLQAGDAEWRTVRVASANDGGNTEVSFLSFLSFLSITFI